MLQACYPEIKFLPWKFANSPRNFWNDAKNRREFMDYIGVELGIHKDNWELWYKVSPRIVIDKGGLTLLTRYYGNNFSKLLMETYPEFAWELWKFSRLSHSAIQDSENIPKMIDYVEKELRVHKPSDWYRVTMDQLNQLGVGSFFRSSKRSRMETEDKTKEVKTKEDDGEKRKENIGLKSDEEEEGRRLLEVLRKVYPNEVWKSELFSRKGMKRSSEKYLLLLLEKIFPNTEILSNFTHKKLRYANSEKPMQLDVFLPELNLAFEYQGKQHFSQLRVYGEVGERMEKDVEKEVEVKKEGITLITIPFWWNQKEETILRSLFRERPELFEDVLKHYKEAAKKMEEEGDEVEEEEELEEEMAVVTK